MILLVKSSHHHEKDEEEEDDATNVSRVPSMLDPPIIGCVGGDKDNDFPIHVWSLHHLGDDDAADNDDDHHEKKEE